MSTVRRVASSYKIITEIETYFRLKPLHGILLSKLVAETNLPHSLPPVSNIESGPSKHNVEVETIDSDARVVLDTQVDVFLDTEPEVAGTGEVFTSQLVFSHLYSTE